MSDIRHICTIKLNYTADLKTFFKAKAIDTCTVVITDKQFYLKYTLELRYWIDPKPAHNVHFKMAKRGAAFKETCIPVYAGQMYAALLHFYHAGTKAVKVSQWDGGFMLSGKSGIDLTTAYFTVQANPLTVADLLNDDLTYKDGITSDMTLGEALEAGNKIKTQAMRGELGMAEGVVQYVKTPRILAPIYEIT